MINRAIALCDWDNVYEGKHLHDQVRLFIKAVLEISRSFIPNKNYYL